MKESSYEIIHKERVICRILDVQIKKHVKNEFVVRKFIRYNDDKKIIFSDTCDLSIYEDCVKAMKGKEPLGIDRFVIRTKCNVVHKWTWDDFYNKKCSYNEVGSIAKDNNGDIINYKEFEIYANTNENCIFTKAYYEKYKYQVVKRWITDALSCYIEVGSCEYRLLVDQNYNQKHSDYFEDQDGYNSYNYDVIDEYMTPEDRIMSALENGEGELYGF